MKKVGEYPVAIPNYPSASEDFDVPTAKILIVDENPLSLMTTSDLLQLDGYETIEAGTEDEVLSNIERHQPDLILLSAMMRSLDSFALCRQIKRNYRTNNIPIVFTTLSNNREERIRAMEAGGSDVLVKPLNRIELSTRVKSLVSQKRIGDESKQTEQILFTIARAIDSRSVTKGGSVRVASLVKSFGQYLGLRQDEIDDLAFAAHLHDIGTIAIPDAIMLKAGALTDEEKELIREHVSLGEEICQSLRHRYGVLPIVRHHHERWDGGGYPDGLSQSDIPYLAQIFQIIDIYDALTSDRPHKQAYSPEAALKIILEETEKGWRNPQLTAQLVQFIRQNSN
ncbi:MAG: HD domain-containing phosphohydrolase [Cyanobacteria bacterium J06623_7]